MYRFIFRAIPLAAALATAACNSSDTTAVAPRCNPATPVAPTGRLTWDDSNCEFLYTTSGGGQIRIGTTGTVTHHITISHTDYDGFDIELWGLTTTSELSANHENLNGKHIKDRIAARRTIVFPDGAKITLDAGGRDAPLSTITIIEGNQSHQIDKANNTLIHSSLVQAEATAKDDAVADGETSRFRFTTEGLVFETIYIENTPGTKTTTEYPLGEINRANPTQVRDFYDDPTLGHT